MTEVLTESPELDDPRTGLVSISAQAGAAGQSWALWA